MSEEPLHFKIRLPPEMHAKLKDFAAKNHRTMSAEILARVAWTLEADEAPPRPGQPPKPLRGAPALDEASAHEPATPAPVVSTNFTPEQLARMKVEMMNMLREEGLFPTRRAAKKKAPTKK